MKILVQIYFGWAAQALFWVPQWWFCYRHLMGPAFRFQGSHTFVGFSFCLMVYVNHLTLLALPFVLWWVI